MLGEEWEDDNSMKDVEMTFHDGFYRDNGGFDWLRSPRIFLMEFRRRMEIQPPVTWCKNHGGTW